MNKRFVFVIGALLAAAAGCDKEPCAACQEEEAEIRHVVFESESDGEDHRVGESLLYVFGPTGELIGCHAAVEGAFDFFLTDDVYDFEAVVNKADLPTVGVTRAQLLSTLTTLAENAPDHLVMRGALDAHRIETDEKITVEVQRIAAKVSCVVHTAFPERLAALPFEIDAIYLTNVAGAQLLSLADLTPDASSIWYNKMDAEGPGEDVPYELIFKQVGRTMGPDESFDAGVSLYAYPNACADDHGREAWSARCTRLVVRARLGDRLTYYPVTLDPVLPNRHYRVDLTVAGYGVEHPEDRLSDYANVLPSVTVVPWDDGGSLEGLY